MLFPFAYLSKLTPFLPTSLSGLMAWWRADLGVTIATGVSAWADQSGNGDSNRNALQATGSKQPTVNSADAAYNNQKTLSFSSAAGQFLRTGTWSSTIAQPCTIVVIGNSGTSATTECFVDGITSGVGRILFDKNNAANYEIFAGQTFSASNTAYGAGGFSPYGNAMGSPSVFVVRFDAHNCAGYVSAQVPLASITLNGADAVGPVSGTNNNVATGLTLGGAVNSTLTLNGKIAEVMVYNRALTYAEQNQIMAYAKARYGVSVADTYVAFDGNSNMYGAGTSAPGLTPSLPYVAPTYSSKRFAGYRNDGLNGQTTTACTAGLSTNFAFVNSGVRNKTFVLLEIQNDLVTNGGSSNANDTSYAATAWSNLIAYSTAARALGATRLVLCTCLPEGSASGAPANYENLRQAVNTLILNNYGPYFDAIADIGGSGSPIGTLASTADASLYAAADTAHLKDAGVVQAAIILGPLL